MDLVLDNVQWLIYHQIKPIFIFLNIELKLYASCDFKDKNQLTSLTHEPTTKPFQPTTDLQYSSARDSHFSLLSACNAHWPVTSQQKSLSLLPA